MGHWSVLVLNAFQLRIGQDVHAWLFDEDKKSSSGWPVANRCCKHPEESSHASADWTPRRAKISETHSMTVKADSSLLLQKTLVHSSFVSFLLSFSHNDPNWQFLGPSDKCHIWCWRLSCCEIWFAPSWFPWPKFREWVFFFYSMPRT